ncbi:hypothetical protein ACMFMG_004357 [Clarireedia jacksonii]
MSVILNTVLWIAIPFIAYKIYRRYASYRADIEFGKSHGCLPPPRIIHSRMFGLDGVKMVFEADSESRLMEHFWEILRKFGMTVDDVSLAMHSFLTIEPENIQCLLSTKFEDFSFGPRKEIMSALLKNGIFVQEGPDWRHSRELLRPQFNFREYGDLAHFSGPMEDLLSCISTTLNNPTSNRIVDLKPLFFRYTLDTTTSFLFGRSVEILKSGDKAVKFEEAFNLSQTIIATKLRVGPLSPLVGGRKLRDACKVVHNFTDEILEKAKESKDIRDTVRDNSYVFLDKISKEIPDRERLRFQILNILIAGRDTTACLLSWCLYLLVRHPEVLRKLRAEVMETLHGKETLTRNDLREVKYLTDVLKETLRLYPSVPVNMRQAVRTTYLPTGGGPDRKSPVLIKKGEEVSFSPYALHRRKDLYGEDAEEFRPERWQEDLPLFRDETTKAWGYLPFNGGPRICLGMDFAMTEAAYVVVKLLQRYSNITLPPHEKVVKTGQEKQEITLVIAPEEGCRLVFDDRF